MAHICPDKVVVNATITSLGTSEHFRFEGQRAIVIMIPDGGVNSSVLFATCLPDAAPMLEFAREALAQKMLAEMFGDLFESN